MGPEDHHERGEEPEPWPESIAAEQHEPEEPALQEEREDAFGGEQAPEHVADEPRVVGPVHAEFEFLDDARRDAEGEDQPVDIRPEEREPPPLRVLRPEVGPAHDKEHQPQPHRERREDEMEARRQGELDPGQEFGIHRYGPSQAEATGTTGSSAGSPSSDQSMTGSSVRSSGRAPCDPK